MPPLPNPSWVGEVGEVHATPGPNAQWTPWRAQPECGQGPPAVAFARR